MSDFGRLSIDIRDLPHWAYAAELRGHDVSLNILHVAPMPGYVTTAPALRAMRASANPPVVALAGTRRTVSANRPSEDDLMSNSRETENFLPQRR
jgi:hypothetical protein